MFIATPVTNNGSSINIPQNRQVTLYCDTKVSNPSVSIIDLYWTKNGVRLTPSPESAVRNRVGGNVLFPDVTFHPVTPADSGVYSCVIVTGEETVKEANFTLEVICK